MPELPEVETIKTAVEKAIGQAKILDITIRNPNLRQKVPSDIKEKTVNATIIKYKRNAKYMLMNLDNGITLIWHMGMSGKIKITDNDNLSIEKHDHIIIKTSNGTIIYNDPRRFGLLVYAVSDKLAENSCFKNTGIDPFNEELNKEYLYKKLQSKKNMPIKTALLDQSIIAGIGNIYASEILYESRISPLRTAKEISKKECEILIENTKKVLSKAIKAGGSTLRDYKKPDGSLGYFQNEHCVYNKTGQKCPNCTCDIAKTGGIKKIVQNGRSTFYCERLQK